MTENKRFELQVDVQGKADIIDWVESKEKNAICIYNDLGVLPFSSAKAVCDKLNELSEENEKLKQELKSFEQVSFTDMCDGSSTVLYMKKENVDDLND